MQCSFDQCDKEARHKTGKYSNLCVGHVSQMIKKGELSPLRKSPTRPVSLSHEERFLAFVNKTEECWLWTGSDMNGYGSFSVNGRTRRAHRIAYELWVEPLAEHSVVHHTCSVRACVNPAHLQLVTPQQNAAEMLERNSYLARIEELEQEVAALRLTKKGWWRRGK